MAPLPIVGSWLLEHGPKELEQLFRAIVFQPAVPILIADNERRTIGMPASAPASCWASPGKRSSAAPWMILPSPVSGR